MINLFSLYPEWTVEHHPTHIVVNNKEHDRYFVVLNAVSQLGYAHVLEQTPTMVEATKHPTMHDAIEHVLVRAHNPTSITTPQETT